MADVVERDHDGDLLVRLTKGEDAPLVALAPERSAHRRNRSLKETAQNGINETQGSLLVNSILQPEASTEGGGRYQPRPSAWVL